MMNGKHCAPRTYTHIEKIRIMNDVIVFMFGCMTLTEFRQEGNRF